MADYRKCTCIACRNEFEQDDDIVVCPECGTPYHRDCWNEYGHCINTELHEKGETWQNPNIKENEHERERVLCPHCGEMNDYGSKVCAHCGKNIEDTEGSRAGGFRGFVNMGQDGSNGGWQGVFPGIMGNAYSENPNEDMGGATVGEVKDFVGKNPIYYLTRFRYFRDSKKKIAPNFVCVLFPQLWFAYRKMWLFMLASIVAFFLLSIPSTIIMLSDRMNDFIIMLQSQIGSVSEAAFESMKARMTSFTEFVDQNYNVLYWLEFICSYMTLALRIVCFLFGNYFYYKHCIRRISDIKENDKSLMDVQSRIRIAGGAGIGYVFLGLLIELALASLMTFIIMFF